MKIQTFSIVAGTALCNAHCPYCISKMTPKQGINLAEPRINWRNFRKACRLAQISRVTTVLLTGKGEPTLYPNQLTQFLGHLNEYDFPLIELQTNGILLARKDYEKHLKKWYDLGLTMIAISIVHQAKEKNQQIFNQNYPDLEKLANKLHKLGFSIRLSCTMLKGYAGDVNEIEKLIEYAKRIGIEQISLRKLAVPLKSENKNIVNWAKKHIVDEKETEKIKKFLGKNGNKLLTSGNAVLYDINGQNVCLTDALTINPETDNIRQIIFFPDGHLKFDWQFKGATLI
jgi:molybdenum cofactor biosynthesis enzyme MoaA